MWRQAFPIQSVDIEESRQKNLNSVPSVFSVLENILMQLMCLADTHSRLLVV